MRILQILLILLLTPILAFSQWDTTGDNSTTGNLKIGSDVADSYSMFKIQGPNSPYGVASRRDIIFHFKYAGQAHIRSYRGGGWDTYLQFLTSDNGNTGGEPLPRLHINGDGNIGIGTTSPSAKLDIAASGDGVQILKFNTERAWAFQQEDSSIYTSLVLKDLTGGKKFKIRGYSNEEAFYVQSNTGDAFFSGNLG